VSSTSDGVDAAAAVISPVSGVSVSTVDGADVLSAAVDPIAAAASYAGGSLLGFGPIASAPLSGLAPVSPAVAFSSATTNGTDALAAAVEVVSAIDFGPGGWAPKRNSARQIAADLHEQRIRRQNETVLAVIMAAVSEGCL
jgi:hypothetical protein